MKVTFDTPMFEEWTDRALAHAVYGGADFGECMIRCPTLLTRAENDPVAAYSETLYDALTCAKTMLHFAAAESAGDHCEMNARTLYHQRTFDWLDGVLAPSEH